MRKLRIVKQKVHGIVKLVVLNGSLADTANPDAPLVLRISELLEVT